MDDKMRATVVDAIRRWTGIRRRSRRKQDLAKAEEQDVRWALFQASTLIRRKSGELTRRTFVGVFDTSHLVLFRFSLSIAALLYLATSA